MIATLDGVALGSALSVSWIEKQGVAPYVLSIPMDRQQANDLFERATRYGSELVLREKDRELRVKRLTILGTAPTDNPSKVELSVVDQRWAWKYVHVPRTYNERRKQHRDIEGAIGSFRATFVQDRDFYSAYSLRDGRTIWTPLDVCKDIMDLVVGEGNWFDRDNVFADNTIDVEDWIFNVQGDAAVSKLLSYMGGSASVYINNDGKAVIYNNQSTKELNQLGLGDSSGKSVTRADLVKLRPLVGPQLFDIQDRSIERPSKIRVHFERHMNIRFDHSELGLQQLFSTTEGLDPLSMENVIQLPYTYIAQGVVIKQGTWLTLDQFLSVAEKEKDSNLLAKILPLTKDRIRRLWLSDGLSSYTTIEVDSFGVFGLLIGALRKHYRTTFRIAKPWNDRIKKYFPYLNGSEKEDVGLTSLIPFFVDNTIVRDWVAYGLGVESVREELYDLVKTRYAVKDQKQNNLIKGSSPVVDTSVDPNLGLMVTPRATVTIIDQEQGIFGVGLASDHWGAASIGGKVFFSATVDEKDSSIKYNARKFLLKDTRLSEEHQASMVVTCAIGAPNDMRRFHTIEVSVEEAERQLSPRISRSKPGRGPILDIVVKSPRAVARYEWFDEWSKFFIDSFSDINSGFNLPPVVEPWNKEQIEIIARAYALSEYIRYRDHPEGSLSTGFRSATVDGSIDSVIHNFSPNGAVTRVDLRSEPAAIDASALLPAEVRRIIDRYVER